MSADPVTKRGLQTLIRLKRWKQACPRLEIHKQEMHDCAAQARDNRLPNPAFHDYLPPFPHADKLNAVHKNMLAPFAKDILLS
jgi:hypothetical protein